MELWVGTGLESTPLTLAPGLNDVPSLSWRSEQAGKHEMNGPVRTLRSSLYLLYPHKTFHRKNNFVRVNKPHLSEPKASISSG